MHEPDILYQDAVDKQTASLLHLDKSAVLALPGYGDFTVFIQNKEVIGSWNRYRLSEDCYHIVFSLTRRLWLSIYRLYLSGIKIDSSGTISKLSDEEIAEYD